MATISGHPVALSTAVNPLTCLVSTRPDAESLNWTFHRPTRSIWTVSQGGTSRSSAVGIIPYAFAPVTLFRWQTSQVCTNFVTSFFKPGHRKFCLIVAYVLSIPGCRKLTWYQCKMSDRNNLGIYILYSFAFLSTLMDHIRKTPTVTSHTSLLFLSINSRRNSSVACSRTITRLSSTNSLLSPEWSCSDANVSSLGVSTSPALVGNRNSESATAFFSPGT